MWASPNDVEALPQMMLCFAQVMLRYAQMMWASPNDVGASPQMKRGDNLCGKAQHHFERSENKPAFLLYCVTQGASSDTVFSGSCGTSASNSS